MLPFCKSLKVSKSQKQFLLKLYCPKNERNIRQNSVLWSLSTISLVFWAFFWDLLTFVQATIQQNTCYLFKCFYLISGFALCQIYLQLSINHKEVMMELNNYENWPVNMWAGGNMEQLKNQIRGLKRICMVSWYCYT